MLISSVSVRRGFSLFAVLMVLTLGSSLLAENTEPAAADVQPYVIDGSPGPDRREALWELGTGGKPAVDKSFGLDARTVMPTTHECFDRSISCNQRVDGTITTGACQNEPLMAYFDVYTLSVTAGQRFVIIASSSQIDPMIRVVAGSQVFEDDDSGGSFDARLEFTVNSNTTLQIGVFAISNSQRTSTGPYSVTITCSNDGGACAQNSTTLCLNGGRFKVQTRWATSNGQSGDGQAVAITGDTGYFWFFDIANVEMVLKVLNACSLSRYWVFAGGLTNVQVTLTVTDTRTGTVKTYINPLGQAFQPIQDTNAFATCP